MRFDEGQRVCVERDEVSFPARGTWFWFRGLKGPVEEINRCRRSADTEYGVRLPRFGLVWFKAHEIRALRGSQRNAGGRSGLGGVITPEA